MTKEEKQLILYRFDKDYVRPTSTNGWVKPEAVAAGGPAVAEIFPDGQLDDGDGSDDGGGGGGGGEEHPLQITDANDDVAAAFFLANG